MPVFAQLTPLQRLTGPHLLPDHADLPAPRACSACSATCRPSSRSASCRRCRTDDLGDEPWEDKALVQTIAHDIRATIQEELLDMVGKRRSVWFG